MRIILTLLFVTHVSALISQDRAMTFEQATQKGISIAKLDSIYPSGLHADSTKAVFWGKQESYMQAYQKALQDLGEYLKKNKFTWGKQTKCFNRIYFSKDGKIDYFLYNFSKDEITIEKQYKFDALLDKFVKKYKFPLTARTGFAQCSPVRYND